MAFTQQLRKTPRTVNVKTNVVRRTPKPKPHKCEWPAGCDRSFSRKPDMIRHLRTVHEGRKDFYCRWPGCDKSFSQQATLSTHENVHTGEKPFLCPAAHCPRAFGDQSSCARHYKEQHTGLTYYCPWCNSTNKRLTEFRNHLLKSHGIPKMKDVDLEEYKLPINTPVDHLAVLPQFTQEGMQGLEMRRKMPGRGRGARHVHPSADSPASSTHPLMNNAELYTMPLSRTPSSDSILTTPELSSGSISPSPSPLDIGVDTLPFESSPRSGYAPSAHGNLLGVEFGTACGTTQVDFGIQGLSPVPQYSAYDPATQTQFVPSQPQGWVKDCIDPQLAGYSGYESSFTYDSNMTLSHAPSGFRNSALQVGWQPTYMTPISQLSRSSHALDTAWSATH